MQNGLPLAETHASFLPTSCPFRWARTTRPLTCSRSSRSSRRCAPCITIPVRSAAQQPVLFVVEDLHWVDPTTLELLTILVDKIHSARILGAVHLSPGLQSALDWRVQRHPGRPHVACRALRSPKLTRRVAQRQVAARTRSSRDVVSKTDGVPLFVEELTKTVLESGLLEEREDRYAADGSPTTAGHTQHAARLADGAAGSPGDGQRPGATRRHYRARVRYPLLQAVSPWRDDTLRRGPRSNWSQRSSCTSKGIRHRRPTASSTP